MGKMNINEAIKKIPETAKKDNWVLTLDRDEGTLFYSPRNIPDGAELYQVTDESALYLDKYSNPLGVMIEYYNINFVEHHPEFKDLTEKVFGESDKNDESTVVKDPREKDEDTLEFKSLLEDIIIGESLTKPLAG